MKNILTPIVALFLSLQLHAAVQTVKFVDANGKEPQEQHYDQQCKLVNCDGNNVISDNNIKLAVGDQLIIQTPKTHSYFYTYRFTINDGTPAAVSNLKTIKAENWYSYENLFYNFNFRAVAPGVDSFNINFVGEVFQAPLCYMPNHLLGNVTLTVVE